MNIYVTSQLFNRVKLTGNNLQKEYKKYTRRLYIGRRVLKIYEKIVYWKNLLLLLLEEQVDHPLMKLQDY